MCYSSLFCTFSLHLLFCAFCGLYKPNAPMMFDNMSLAHTSTTITCGRELLRAWRLRNHSTHDQESNSTSDARLASRAPARSKIPASPDRPKSSAGLNAERTICLSVSARSSRRKRSPCAWLLSALVEKRAASTFSMFLLRRWQHRRVRQLRLQARLCALHALPPLKATERRNSAGQRRRPAAHRSELRCGRPVRGLKAHLHRARTT